MGSGAAINWTVVLVAALGAVPSTIAAVAALLNRRSLRTPSGDPIGHVAERAEHASHVDVAMSRHVLAHVTGDPEQARRTLTTIEDGGD